MLCAVHTCNKSCVLCAVHTCNKSCVLCAVHTCNKSCVLCAVHTCNKSCAVHTCNKSCVLCCRVRECHVLLLCTLLQGARMSCVIAVYSVAGCENATCYCCVLCCRVRECHVLLLCTLLQGARMSRVIAVYSVAGCENATCYCCAIGQRAASCLLRTWTTTERLTRDWGRQRAEYHLYTRVCVWYGQCTDVVNELTNLDHLLCIIYRWGNRLCLCVGCLIGVTPAAFVCL